MTILMVRASVGGVVLGSAIVGLDAQGRVRAAMFAGIFATMATEVKRRRAAQAERDEALTVDGEAVQEERAA